MLLAHPPHPRSSTSRNDLEGSGASHYEVRPNAAIERSKPCFVTHSEAEQIDVGQLGGRRPC